MMKPVILSVSFLALVASAGASSLAEAHRGDFLVGVALGGTVPKDYSTAERKLLEREFNQLTPENCMKPESVQPQEGKWTFEMADALVDYAKKRGVPVYGHTLVWHQQTPDWFLGTATNRPRRRSPSIASRPTSPKSRAATRAALPVGMSSTKPSRTIPVNIFAPRNGSRS